MRSAAALLLTPAWLCFDAVHLWLHSLSGGIGLRIKSGRDVLRRARKASLRHLKLEA